MKSFGNIAKDGQVRAVASGTLTDGKAVIVNSDGTVSVVGIAAASVGSATVFDSGIAVYATPAHDVANNKIVVAYRDANDSDKGYAVVGTVSGTSISFGTRVVFATGGAAFTFTVYEPVAEKIVIFYANGGNSDYGTGVVGTVSGTSISFGTPVVFNSATSYFISAAYDANAQKIVVSTSDYTNYQGRSAVATVSGTSISFGSTVTFESGNAYYTSTAYDSVNQKVVIAYFDDNNSDQGTAIVGTVSGTSISFGTAVVYNNASVAGLPKCVYDSAQGKIVIVYNDGGNSAYGTAIVGTVSGTSISFGSEVVFESASTLHIGATYDASAEKVVITYYDGGNSNYGTVISGTVSGTSISFDSPLVYNTARSDYSSPTYDSTAEKVVICYMNKGSSDDGTALVYSSPSTTLTSENFIGFSDGAYATTQSAAINTANTIDRNQSGLTAGQTYFVQNNGTIGTTAADPSVTAGTAISATELIVKG